MFPLYTQQEFENSKCKDKLPLKCKCCENTVKNKIRYAIPDFYIPKYNLIVEIKSSYTLNTQNMKDKVVSYLNDGFNFKLLMHKENVDMTHLVI